MSNARPEPSRAPEVWRRYLGRKVSLRYRLHDDDSAHPFSEAIGMVASVRSESGSRAEIHIVNRRGASSTIPLEDIVAAKVFD
ncbi:MAG: hypothetical protein M3516_01305 [Actinomycetota bacterium]|nr:hypothetical protein [Actinomycetota bacterium]